VARSLIMLALLRSAAALGWPGAQGAAAGDALPDLLKSARVTAGQHDAVVALPKALGEDGTQAGRGAGYHSHRGGATEG
jgi:hypothetical protein